MEITKLLIEYGAIVNVRRRDKWSPLHLAAWQGKLKRVNLLKINRIIVKKYYYVNLFLNQCVNHLIIKICYSRRIQFLQREEKQRKYREKLFDFR